MKMHAIFAGLLLLHCLSSNAQNNLPYLGQTPPGLTAVRFPPDSLLATKSWMWHSTPMFSYDGMEMFWTKYSEPVPQTGQIELFTMLVENNNWSAVHRPAFADTNYQENNSLYTSGIDTLFYYSDRPASFINMVVRTATGWGEPQLLQVPLPSNCVHQNTFSIAKNRDIYVDLLNQKTMKSDIYISKFENGNYQMTQALGPEINSTYDELCPFIDPDEGYLIFGSKRPGGFGAHVDLYISFKNEDQTWTNAINMGYEVNSTNAFFPFVTLDKQYLFFTTIKQQDIGYNPYWISASVIDTLRLLVGTDKKESPTGQLKLNQNYPNPVLDQTTFSFDIPQATKMTFEIHSIMNGSKLNLFENKFFQKGRYSLEFDASALPAGVYLYNITSAEKATEARKMVVL